MGIYLTIAEKKLPYEEQQQLIAKKKAERAAKERQYDHDRRNDPNPVAAAAYKRKRNQSTRDCRSRSITLPKSDRIDRLTDVHGKIAESHADYMKIMSGSSFNDNNRNENDTLSEGEIVEDRRGEGEIVEDRRDDDDAINGRDSTEDRRDDETDLRITRRFDETADQLLETADEEEATGYYGPADPGYVEPAELVVGDNDIEIVLKCVAFLEKLGRLRLVDCLVHSHGYTVRQAEKWVRANSIHGANNIFSAWRDYDDTIDPNFASLVSSLARPRNAFSHNPHANPWEDDNIDFANVDDFIDEFEYLMQRLCWPVKVYREQRMEGDIEYLRLQLEQSRAYARDQADHYGQQLDQARAKIRSAEEQTDFYGQQLEQARADYMDLYLQSPAAKRRRTE